MTASILSIVAIGAAVFWWWLQRRTDPKQQHRDRYEQIDRDIAKQNSGSALAHSSADLDELERLERMQNQGRRDS